jgi:hypothetical protein
MTDTQKLLAEAEALGIPWIDSPFFPALFDALELDEPTKKLIRDFSQNGYAIFDPQIPDAWIDGAFQEVGDKFYVGAGNFYSDERRVQDAWVWGEHVRKIANAPRVLQVLELLYRRKAFPFQTLNFRIGSEQKTHSDKAFFDSIPHGFMCGVWVALESVDESNGPLHYYPQSHKLPTFNLNDLGVMASAADNPLHNVGRYEQFVEALMPVSGCNRTELKIEKGQALIWAANLYHGGCPILDKARTRFTQVTHYYFEGCLYYTPLHSDPGIGRMTARKIYHAGDGSVVPQFYNGRMIANPGEWPPRFTDEVEQVLEQQAVMLSPVQTAPAAPEQVKKLSLLKRAFEKLRA